MLSPLTLTKEERISSKKLLEKLFDRTAKRSVAAYPLRAVYIVLDGDEAAVPVQVMVSVPKRLLHHAVQRNRTKRQIREAYRKHKAILIETAEAKPGKKIAIGFVWLDSQLHDSGVVERCVCRLLGKIREVI